MYFKIFSLYPEIFSSFLETSLIHKAILKKIIQVDLINWRQDFGIGNYRQVDDRPYGGGTGMILKLDPIYNALKEHESISELFIKPQNPIEYKRVLPNNSIFYENWQRNKTKRATIMLTPKGFSLNQNTAKWLSGFEQLSIICGRFEGFDARASEFVDLELSIGDYILNGAETASMVLVESISRLLPGFVTKENSVLHDSFSENLNFYNEQAKFTKMNNFAPEIDYNLFNNSTWLQNKLPYIEHPQFTRPSNWNDWLVPNILQGGDHKKIQNWRLNWY